MSFFLDKTEMQALNQLNPWCSGSGLPITGNDRHDPPELTIHATYVCPECGREIQKTRFGKGSEKLAKHKLPKNVWGNHVKHVDCCI